MKWLTTLGVISLISIQSRFYSVEHLKSNIIYNNLNLLSINKSKSYSSFIDAYIDGDSKIYFNDINDSEVIEDIWNYNEIKVVSVNIDLSKLDKSNKFIELTLPLGMELKMNPDSLVDKKNILSVDTSNYQQEQINLSTGEIYKPKTGIIRYEIAPNALSINLNFLISIDNSIWGGFNNTYANSEDNKAIIITSGDDNIQSSKKIDRIKVSGSSNQTSIHFPNVSKVMQGEYVTSSATLYLNNTTSSNSKIYKKVVAEFEIPHVVRNKDGTEKKYYIEVDNITSSNNGYYSIQDNKIIFEWDNLRANTVNIKFTSYIDENSFKEGEVIRYKSENLELTTFTEKEPFKTSVNLNTSSTIISNKKENFRVSTSSHTLYKEPKENEALNYAGEFYLENYGINTSRKSILFEVPTNKIGIKTIKMPLIKECNSLNVKVVLWDRILDKYIEGVIPINKNNPQGHIFNVKEAISKIDIDFSNPNEVYFSSIEYEIGSIPNGYTTGREGSYPASFGSIYGKTLRDSVAGDKYIVTYTIKDLENSSTPDIIKTSTITITDVGKTTMASNTLNFEDSTGKSITEIMAGNSFNIKGNLFPVDYPYHTTLSISKPIVHVCLPKKMTINENLSSFKLVKNGVKKDVDFEVTNKNNPRELENGYIVFDFEVTDPDFLIGYYSEDWKLIGQLEFSINVDISKSTKTTSLNIRDVILIEDKEIKSINSGSWGAYYNKDIYDVNNNGDRSEYLTTLNHDKYLSVVSNTEWLDVDISSEGSSDNGNKGYQPIEDISDVIKYGLTINNNNDGYVRTGKMEYFIPVPKKDVEYNSYIKEDGGTFNFDMELTEKVEDTLGFDISYTYNNEDYLSYSDDLDLNKVSMVRVINNRDISPGETIEFKISMKYSEDSWNGDENINSWNIYGQQTYEKNGLESTFLHVLDTFKVELILNPKILKNPESKSVKVGESVIFSTSIDVGIPVATGNWQYRESSSDTWKDLNETSTTLFIDNVSYNLNGYEYRYVATNKGDIVESLPATLTVTDKEGPIITLNEFKDGDVYKITITAIDNGSGISHIILPDGTRVDSNTYTMIADVNTEYTFKVYDLAGNESIKSTMIGVIVPNTITSNLDVYIKSENILQMSLDTNSITFDDFSGVEDAIKENAINLTINSSLPYSINAYLLTEVQNSDKSKTMNKEILNIKENSETDYKNFSNINEKVVLKDNCSAGNRLNHGIDIKLKGRVAHEKDVYKTTIKFEVEQK